MIITRTPLRISFVGGGTDLPGYASKYTGEVVSAAIDKYVYVTVNQKFDGRVHLRYSHTEVVSAAQDLQHGIVRECLKLLGINRGIEIATISDVPMRGTGLGSSSSLTVGLLEALYAYRGRSIAGNDLAEMACQVEIDLLKAPIGKQDQYAVAYGGVNHFMFMPSGVVEKRSIAESNGAIHWLEETTMLFYLGRTRQSKSILDDQSAHIEEKKREYDSLRGLVHDLLGWLYEDEGRDRVGWILDRAWEQKKKLSAKVSDVFIDTLYRRAKEAGAAGGKVCGAGGGGFLLLIVPEAQRGGVVQAMSPLQEMPFKFDREGAKVIYNDGC